MPVAIVLGALHGLEPGHSKTMMAAFIVAIRGTVRQAVLLGLAATLSHTAVIWALAFVGLHYSGKFNAEQTEPYFQMATGVIVVGMAAWMCVRARRETAARHHRHHAHEAHSPHGGVLLPTGHGFVEVSVFETHTPPHLRLYFLDGKKRPLSCPKPESVRAETVRPNGSRQTFTFVAEENHLRATTDLPEPHEFKLLVTLSHDGHAHTFETEVSEDHHPHAHGKSGEEFQDAHEREHAAEIEKRFANRNVTTGQLVLFGLTGGLLPCPSAFAVLMVCLQLKEFTLGFALVLAFSIGLAITLVSVGSFAAISVKHASKHFKGFGAFARKAPYVSSAVLALIGLLIGLEGIRHLLR
ncbi:MAG: sulfite exporter TauE/SafE family protein [Limisphaerales bacterium]